MEKVHPDDVAFKVRTWLENLKSGNPHDACRFRGADGRYRWFAVRAEPLRANDGGVLSWYGVLIDIDDRKKVEEAVRESELVRQVIDTVPGLLWSIGPDGELTQINQGVLDYSGMRFEDHLGFYKFHHPYDLSDAVNALSQAMQTGTSYQGLSRLRRADGEYRWHRVHAEPLRDHEGHIIQWYGFSFDIDEGKKAEDQLRRSEAYLAEAQRLTPPRLDAFHRRLSLVGRNLSHSRIRTGVKPTMERVVQRVHPDDLAIVRQVIDEASRGDKVNVTHRLLMPDGSVKFLHVLGYALKDAAGNLEIVGAVMDVTERKRAEQALRESEAKFRAAIDGIAGLVAIMAPGGELEAANRPIVEYFGRTVEELKNWGTSDAVHPEDLPRVLEIIRITRHRYSLLSRTTPETLRWRISVV